MGLRDIPQSVRIAWTVNAQGLIVACNNAFCVVMGYGREEVVDHPGRRLLRPHHTSADDSEIAAIAMAQLRLKLAQSVEEHIVSWIETRDGRCIELSDAVMTFNLMCGLWEVVADISVDYLDGPQFQTPWDHLRWRNYRLENLAMKVDDMADRLAHVRTEDDEIEERLRKPKKPRKARPDKGDRLIPADDFDERLHRALGDGKVAVRAVMKATLVGSTVTLTKYLKPYWKKEKESPAQTLRRLAVEWYPKLYLF
jgi:PAS domain S-box-containing protein